MIMLRLLSTGSVGAQATALCARMFSLGLSSPTACKSIGSQIKNDSLAHMHPKAAPVMPSIDTVCM